MVQANNMDIIGLVETKRSDEHPVTEMPTEYSWIGKNRVKNRGGGIGFLIHNSISVKDDNLLNSHDDEHERLWISVKAHNTCMAVGVTYFPVDNTNPDLANELCNELIQNIA